MTTLAGLPCATPAIPPAVTFHECPFQAIEAAWLTCPTASARGSLHPLRRIPAKPQKNQLVNRVCIVFLPPTAFHAGSIVGLDGGRPALSQEIVVAVTDAPPKPPTRLRTPSFPTSLTRPIPLPAPLP